MKKDKKQTYKKWLKYMAFAGIILNTFAIIILVIALLFTEEKLSKVNSRLAYLTDNTDIILSGVDNLQQNLESTLEEERSLIESCKLEVVDTDFNAGTYTVDITVVPKQFTETTSTYMYFGTQEFALELKGFRYMGSAVLPLSETYENNVTVLFVDESKRQTEVLTNFDGLINDFDDVLSASIGEMPKYEDGKLGFTAPIAYEIDGGERFEFSTLALIVEADGVPISMVDMMESYTAAPSTEEEEEDEDEDDRSSAGSRKDEIRDEAVAEDTEAEEGKGHTLTSSRVFQTVSGSYVSNEDIEVKAGAKIRIYLRAVSLDGFAFEYEVFNGLALDEDQGGFEESDNYFDSNPCVYDNKGGCLRLK